MVQLGTIFTRSSSLIRVYRAEGLGTRLNITIQLSQSYTGTHPYMGSQLGPCYTAWG